MTDRLTDLSFFEKTYESSGIQYYNDDLKGVLKNIIKELYLSHKHLLPKLRIHHIDWAIFKYNQAKEKRIIHNTKQYLKACIVSAVYESSLDQMEPID